MRIKVISNYDYVKSVNAVDLRRLIAENRILAFRRSDGWVKIGADPVRGEGGDYFGPERRNIRQKSIPEPQQGVHFCLLPNKTSDNSA